MASAGGVWMALVYGFAGMRDVRGSISFDPRMPEQWTSMSFKVIVRGIVLSVRLEHESIALVPDAPMDVTVRGKTHRIEPGGGTVIHL